MGLGKNQEVKGRGVIPGGGIRGVSTNNTQVKRALKI